MNTDITIPKIPGIYKITNSIDKRIYIGSSSCLRRRKNEHHKKLRKDIHRNPRLQNFYNKYGEESIKFQVILYCSKDSLLKIEQQYLDKLNPFFNICEVAGRTTGFSFSEEQRKQLSKAKKKFFEDGGKPWNKGRTKPQGEKEKISQSLKEYYKNNPHPFEGETHTEKAKRKMVAANKRRKGTHHKGANGKIVMLDIETKKPLKLYISSGAAAEESSSKGTIKTASNKIREAIKYDRTAYGYKWEYAKNLDQTKLDELLES